MSEHLTDHMVAIVEKFWSENPDLKIQMFRTWYNGHDAPLQLNDAGKDAVAKYIAKGAIQAAKKAMGAT